LDDFSKFNWVLFLKNKGNAFNKFEDWYMQTTNNLYKSIKYIKSDNVNEFLSNNFKNFCRTKGIIHLLTVPYTPQQNGRIERLNGILTICASSMLEDTKVLGRCCFNSKLSTQ